MINLNRISLNHFTTGCLRSPRRLAILVGLAVWITWAGYPSGPISGQQRSSVPESALSQAGLDDYALNQRAQNMLDAGRKDEAERLFRQVAQKYPTSLLSRSASLQAAGSAFVRGSYQQTLEDLTPLLEKNDGTALKMAIDALTKLNRRNEALRRIRQLHFEAPQSAEAEQTDVLLREIGVSSIGGDSQSWRRRADKLFQAGLWLVAGEAYRRLEEQFSDQSTDEVRLLAGRSFYKGNSFQEATAALQRVRSRNQNTSSEAQYYLGMAQLSLENESAAIEALNALRRTAAGSRHEAGLLYGLGQYHLKRGREEKTESWFSELVSKHPEADQADEAHFWLAWRAHSSQNHGLAARLLTEHIARYSDKTDNRGRAGFWAAVNQERSGNRARAMTLYRGLLMRYGASWYGINAEKRISKLAGQGIQGQSINTDQTLRQAILGLQTIRKASETLGDANRERLTKAEALMRLGLHQSALNELEAARLSLPDSPRINLRIAQILRDNGDAVGAINALKRAYPDYGQSLPNEMSREEWEIFYPLKWWSEIRQEARRNQIDPYLIAGIIRQETVFNPRARSRANAIGLMQLLPSTGIAVAKKNSVANGRISSADLYNPTLNIKLGTAYVKEMLDRFERFEYVAAAYNGGPTRVSRWLREMPEQEIEDWVERIPISETRLYVQGVYRNSIHYQRLYDENGKFREAVRR
ncbi:MAG: transglycosylase SLT domain-containing protein [Acidobacteriota bacterium]